MATSKGRYYACVFYLDSLPGDYEERIMNCGLPISFIIHDSDTEPSGELKKIHGHAIIVFNGPVSQKHANDVIKQIFNGTCAIRLDSCRGYYRYFFHLDNPEKFQYDCRLVQCRNGFNIDDYTSKTQRELRLIQSEIEEFICENRITEYCLLCNVYRLNGDWEHYDYLTNHTYHFHHYLMSIRESGFFNE